MSLPSLWGKVSVELTCSLVSGRYSRKEGAESCFLLHRSGTGSVSCQVTLVSVSSSWVHVQLSLLPTLLRCSCTYSANTGETVGEGGLSSSLVGTFGELSCSPWLFSQSGPTHRVVPYFQTSPQSFSLIPSKYSNIWSWHSTYRICMDLIS
jgi:hypothetical protein